jgi:stalled ribosome alternative rescue factor ArfA
MAKDKEKPKLITPSAKAGVMQPKFRSKTEKPKKGKGSYKRKPENKE